MGDLHFSNLRDWDLESFENFLKWLDSYDFGDPEQCELLQLGDATERALNDGKPIDLLTRFAAIVSKKFRKAYILGGNHCHKLDDYGVSQYSTQYLTSLDSEKFVTIYDEKVFTTVGAMTVMALPFKYTFSSLETYYNEQLPTGYYDTEVDLICGHVGIFDEDHPYIDGLKLDKFKFKNAVFGHIHQRVGKHKKLYTGSVMPFRRSEEQTELQRCIKVYDERTGQELPEIPIPIFRTYQVVDYRNAADELKFHKNSEDGIVHVYEFKNVKKDKQVVKDQYKDFYIKFLMRNDVLGDEQDDSKENRKSLVFNSHWEAFQQMVKDEGLSIKRKTFAILRDVLNRE